MAAYGYAYEGGVSLADANVTVIFIGKHVINLEK